MHSSEVKIRSTNKIKPTDYVQTFFVDNYLMLMDSNSFTNATIGLFLSYTNMS